MMHTSQALYDNLGATLLELNKQIDAVTKNLQAQIATLPYPERVTVHDMKHTNGHWCLAELLAAKAQTLNAMAMLKATDTNSKFARKKGEW